MNAPSSPPDLARALMGNIRNLALVSRTQTTLTAFCDRLVASIQSMAPETVFKEYSGREFLPLISRLNQEVAPCLHAHKQVCAQAAAMHVWVIHNAERLSDAQQSIICRLIELFPALPFRVIWLSSQALSEWKNPVELDRLVLDLDAPPMPAGANTAAHTLTSQRSATSLMKPLKVGTTLAATALLGSWVWMTSSVSPGIPDTPAPTASTPAQPQASDAAASVEVTAHVKVTTPPPSPPETEPQQTSRDVLSLPDIVRTGERWLKSLPADSHVVEHGAFNTLEQARKFQSKHKELGMAHIIAVRKTPNAENWQYTVVTGYFRSDDRAKRYVSRLDWRANTRIRATDKLKPLLVSAP